MLGVRLDAALDKELTSFLKKSKRKRSDVVKEALRQYLLQRLEEDWHDRKTIQAWESISLGRMVSLKEVDEYLKTWE